MTDFKVVFSLTADFKLGRSASTATGGDYRERKRRRRRRRRSRRMRRRRRRSRRRSRRRMIRRR